MVEMRLQPSDQVRRDDDQLAVSEFAVFEGSGVQGHGAVPEECLDFCHEQLVGSANVTFGRIADHDIGKG